jgi:formylglycine-generating enzyme required for sulfatase activity
LKKNKKKQEQIFSALEEIRIEKTGKIFFEPTIIPRIKEPEKTKALLHETISVLPSEPSQPISSLAAVALSAEQEMISPEREKKEPILIPTVSGPAPGSIPQPSTETFSSPGKHLSDGQEIVAPEKKKAHETTMGSSEPEPAIISSPKPSTTISLTPAASLPDFSFVFIAPGKFIMGSPESESGRNDDELPHEVDIAHGFFIQTTPVTQEQWKTVMKNNSSRFFSQGDDHPVESVSWYDCQKFIELLNSMGDHIYRLPTEAEWEYACRAGKTSSCSEGEIVELFCHHDPNLDAAGWYCGNSSRSTHPVARKRPNLWGLYDVHGNVLEWCQDWYGTYPATPQTDPSGPITGPGRVIRGGSWFSNAKNCRAAARFYWSPNAKSDFIGFRLIRKQKTDS